MPYRWVITKRTRRSKGLFGGRSSETITYRPAQRGAQRRTRTVGFFKPRDTVTEEWLFVDDNDRVVTAQPFVGIFVINGVEYRCSHEHRTQGAARECAEKSARQKSRELGLEPPTFRRE